MAAEPAVSELVARGTAAHLAGDYERAVRDLQRAFHICHDDGDPAGAFAVAFSLAMVFGTSCQPALFSGWVTQARRLFADLAPEAETTSAARGYLDLLELHGGVMTGDFATVARLAPGVTAAGRLHHDPDLVTLGTVALGRSAIYAGDVRGGLAQLDEVMAGVLSGEPGPLAAGLAWCAAIEGCQEIGAVDRLCEWTSALASWCQSPPVLELFNGHCSVHRGQVLAVHGKWEEALAVFADSRQRHQQRGDVVAAGWAERSRGEVLRLQGRHEDAAAAYRTAADLGCDPQPGLALLWLGRGRAEDALAAVHRCLAETVLPAHRVSLLPAAAEVLLAAGATEDPAGPLIAETDALADELDALAELTGCASVTAAAAHAHAGVELARRDPGGALPYARKAVQGWGGVGCPFEVARSRVVLARALAGAADVASARDELAAARDAFVMLGAEPAVADAESLLETWARPTPTEREEPEEPADGIHAGGRPDDHPDGLTGRELEVLALVAAGRSNRQIAAELVISEKTVARHLSNIFTKIDVGSRTSAAVYAFQRGLASSP
ncbi:LuxR C-terminal-related transcriptional regulator [Microbacterium sp. A93]|uniref:LuxR C-terminal-related transcriptional regulator n=1 Tax=Microbacterium sp. A93 TaxID=3450716 RepID=UPI003F42221D